MNISHDAYEIKAATLCVGLDTTLEKLPDGIARNLEGMVEFNREIINATADLCSSYKINFAFYEQFGSAGVAAMEKTLQAIPHTHVRIADAKRGDIGNTAEAYARSVFEAMDFDAVTVNPYMGADTVAPFLDYADKLVFVLALTSNPGSRDFQQRLIDGVPLYLHVMRTALTWQRRAAMGFVVGATNAKELHAVRHEFPEVPLLVPGVGAQGADAAEIRDANAGGPAFVNSSRAILYASSSGDFAQKAREVAKATSSALNP